MATNRTILMYYDPSVLKNSEEGDVEVTTIEGIKEKAQELREMFTSSVLIRDASRFCGVEHGVSAVDLLGNPDSECLDTVLEAYTEAGVEAAGHSSFISGEGPDLGADSEQDDISVLKARATELGVHFEADASRDDLARAIFAAEEPPKTEEVVTDFDIETADFDALKTEAARLELNFPSNIGEETLRKRVHAALFAGCEK